LLPSIQVLYPFTVAALSNDNSAVLYLHWRKLIPLLWPDLFMKNNFSWIGIVTQTELHGEIHGFVGRKNLHTRRNTINHRTEEMIPIAKGPAGIIKRLEAVAQALCKYLINL
jgi:hypothetical protein